MEFTAVEGKSVTLIQTKLYILNLLQSPSFYRHSIRRNFPLESESRKRLLEKYFRLRPEAFTKAILDITGLGYGNVQSHRQLVICSLTGSW
jgi:hypothetical protein